MQYLILIHSSEAAWEGLSPAEMERGMGAFRAYADALVAAGKNVASSQLAPAGAARNISARGVLDGPYVDIKEQLGGFYLIEVADEAEALEWAKKCPGVHYGGVELRKCI